MKIEDPLLEPYSITVDGENFVLAIEKNYDKKGSESGEQYTVQQQATYYYDIKNLIKAVIKNKVKEGEDTIDLEEFLRRYKAISDLINEKLNKVL